MRQRWIIRGLLIGLLTLCIGGWAWSVQHGIEIDYYFLGGRRIAATTDTGEVYLGGGWFNGHPPGWIRHVNNYDTFKLWPPRFSSTAFTFQFLGFSYWHLTDPRSTNCGIGVPYWFLCLFLMLIWWPLWRKTRPPHAGGAFPVEPQDKQADHGTANQPR